MEDGESVSGSPTETRLVHLNNQVDKDNIDRQLITDFWSHEIAYKLDVVIQFFKFI